MAVNACDICGCVPSNMEDIFYFQASINLLCQIASNTGSSGSVQAVSSCLEVTTGGAWGSVGDRITETRWYDVSTNPPTLLSTLYFNEDTQAAVTGITSGNTQPCPGADVGESCANPTFTQLCATATGLTSPVRLEDSASASADAGIVGLIQRADVEGDTTTTNGDYAVPHEYDGRISVTQRDRIQTTTLSMASTSNVTTDFDLDGMSTVSVYFGRTTETGTLNFQVSLDGTNYNNVTALSPTNNIPNEYQNNFSTNGTLNLTNSATVFTLPAAGYKFFRIKVASTGSGTALPVNIRGSQGVNSVAIAHINPGIQAFDLGKQEDAAAGSGDVGVSILQVRQLNQADSVSADGDYGNFKMNDLGSTYVDTVRRGTPVTTTPTMLTATSVTIAAANAARRYLLIQNNSAANIMFSITNATLTGIVPTSTNIGHVLLPTGSYESPPNQCSTTAITAYQTSGGTINTVTVTEA